MPNYKPRGKFKLTVGNVPPESVGAAIERLKLSPEQVVGVSKFSDGQSHTVLLATERDGWIQIAANLQAGMSGSEIAHDIRVKLTDAINDMRARQDKAILDLRNNPMPGKRPHSAGVIARKLKLPIDRVKRVLALHRRQTVRNG